MDAASDFFPPPPAPFSSGCLFRCACLHEAFIVLFACRFQKISRLLTVQQASIVHAVVGMMCRSMHTSCCCKKKRGRRRRKKSKADISKKPRSICLCIIMQYRSLSLFTRHDHLTCLAFVPSSIVLSRQSHFAQAYAGTPGAPQAARNARGRLLVAD